MNPAQHILVFLARAYRAAISPALTAIFGPLGFGCRFTPTCSQYAIDAVKAHGAIKGCGLTLGRLCRCQPWGGSGFDPVPPARSADAPRPQRVRGSQIVGESASDALRTEDRPRSQLLGNTPQALPSSERGPSRSAAGGRQEPAESPFALPVADALRTRSVRAPAGTAGILPASFSQERARRLEAGGPSGALPANPKGQLPLNPTQHGS